MYKHSNAKEYKALFLLDHPFFEYDSNWMRVGVYWYTVYLGAKCGHSYTLDEAINQELFWCNERFYGNALIKKSENW